MAGQFGMESWEDTYADFVLIILILLIVDKTYIKIGTLICMFLGGPIIDGFTFLLGDYLNQSLPAVSADFDGCDWLCDSCNRNDNRNQIRCRNRSE